jgi:hypothetical protein
MRDPRSLEQLSAAARGDRVGGSGWDQPGFGLGESQRPLAVEHRLQPGAVAQLIEQSLRCEDRVEHRYTGSRPT